MRRALRFRIPCVPCVPWAIPFIRLRRSRSRSFVVTPSEWIPPSRPARAADDPLGRSVRRRHQWWPTRKRRSSSRFDLARASLPPSRCRTPERLGSLASFLPARQTTRALRNVSINPYLRADHCGGRKNPRPRVAPTDDMIIFEPSPTGGPICSCPHCHPPKS